MVYRPSKPTVTTLEGLRQWVEDEFMSIQGHTAQREDILDMRSLHVEPTRPRTGMLVFADGTDWNPGSGEGFYEYRGGAWHKL